MSKYKCWVFPIENLSKHPRFQIPLTSPFADRQGDVDDDGWPIQDQLAREVQKEAELKATLESCKNSEDFNLADLALDDQIERLSESNTLIRNWKNITVEDLLEQAVLDQKWRVKSLRGKQQAYEDKHLSSISTYVDNKYGLNSKLRNALVLGKRQRLLILDSVV